MTKFLSALMLFLGVALAGAPLMAQCKGCEDCGDKKAEKKCCEEGAKGCCDKGECKDCGGCDKKEVAAGNTYVVAVEGIHCVKCAASVQKKLAAIEGVEKVSVDEKSGKATVTMKEGKTLEKAAVETALKESEFTAKSVTKAEAKKDETKEAKKEG